MKVIFLDIDGVLNTDETYLKQNDSIVCLDDFRIEYLKMIVEATEAKIVLSSANKVHFKKVDDKVVPVSNRSLYAPEFIESLNKHGLALYDILPTVINSEGKMQERQVEIKVWLSQHEDVENFVILDDETTFLMDFVGTNFIILNRLPIGEMVRDMSDATGLCEEHVEQAINILNSKKQYKRRTLHK